MKNRDISIEFLIYRCEALRYLRTSFPLPLLVWITQVLRALSSSQGHSLCCWSWVCCGACKGAWYARQFPDQVKTRQEKTSHQWPFWEQRSPAQCRCCCLQHLSSLWVGRQKKRQPSYPAFAINSCLMVYVVIARCITWRFFFIIIFFLYVDLNILLYLLRETDCLRPQKPFPLSWQSPVPHSWCEFCYYHLQFKKIKPILEGKKRVFH